MAHSSFPDGVSKSVAAGSGLSAGYHHPLYATGSCPVNSTFQPWDVPLPRSSLNQMPVPGDGGYVSTSVGPRHVDFSIRGSCLQYSGNMSGISCCPDRRQDTPAEVEQFHSCCLYQASRGTSSRTLLKEVTPLLDWTESHLLQLLTVYTAGPQNQEAKLLLLPSVFCQMTKWAFRPEVELKHLSSSRTIV